MLPSMENNPGSSLDHIHLPPGFRFHPSDEELIVHYLMTKITSCPLPASIITEIDLYKYSPWELDDWMHCRLRKKIGFPGKVSSNEINGHLPGLIQFWPSNLNTHVEVTKSNLYNDCPMLPYIFSFPGTPYTETTSSQSLLSSLNSCMSVHQEDSEKQNMQIPDSLENFFNPLKRKLMEQNQGKSSIVLPSNKLVNGDAAMYCSDINNFRERDRDQSEGSNFSPDVWSSTFQNQELNYLDFRGTSP